MNPSKSTFYGLVFLFFFLSTGWNNAYSQFHNWTNCFNNNFDLKFNRKGPLNVCADTAQLGTTYKGSNQTIYWSDGYVGANRIIGYSGYYQVAIFDDSSWCADTSDWIYVQVSDLKNTVYTEYGNTEAKVCDGTAVKLFCYSKSASGFRWNTGDTTNSITVTKSGKYYVTQTSKSNCNDTSNKVSITVVTLKTPKIKALTDTTLCNGDTVKLECYQYEGKLLWLPYYTSAPKTDVTNDGEYYVFVQDSLSGCYANSNRINVRFKKPVAAQLCMVTVDSATGKNKLVWKNQGEPATKYIIYREGNIAYNYNDLGEVSNNNGSMEFLDTNSIPKARPYSYYIAAVDSCGNTAEESKFYAHTTLHLTASLGVNGENNLNWSDYLGIYPLTTYSIYRSNKNGAFTLLARVSTNVKSYSDLNPPSGGNRYYIGIDASNYCNSGSSSTETINSNMVAFGILNTSDIDIASLSVYPNPASDYVTFQGLSNRDYPVSVIQSNGMVVKTEVVSASNPSLSVHGITQGLYFLKFENGRTLPLTIVNR